MISISHVLALEIRVHQIVESSLVVVPAIWMDTAVTQHLRLHESDTRRVAAEDHLKDLKALP